MGASILFISNIMHCLDRVSVSAGIEFWSRCVSSGLVSKYGTYLSLCWFWLFYHFSIIDSGHWECMHWKAKCLSIILATALLIIMHLMVILPNFLSPISHLCQETWHLTQFDLNPTRGDLPNLVSFDPKPDPTQVQPQFEINFVDQNLKRIYTYIWPNHRRTPSLLLLASSLWMYF